MPSCKGSRAALKRSGRGHCETRRELRSAQELLLRDHDKLAALHERQATEYEALITKHGGLKSIHKGLEMQHRELEDRCVCVYVWTLPMYPP